MDLYPSLVLRLREDAAAALSELLRVRGVSADVKPEHILTRRITVGWVEALCADVAVGGASEAEALCAFIERARYDAERAGGIAPLHLVEQLAHQADALAVYRTWTARLVRGVSTGMLDGLRALDGVAEASGYADEMTALSTLLEPAPEIGGGAG